MKLHKSYQAEIKAQPGDAGIVEMYVSMFGNVDLVGDRVVKGAFQKSLENFKADGDPIPMIWNHQWEDPNAHIGKVLDAEETDQGLRVKAQLDMDQPFAAQVFRLLKERRVKEASFAYDVVRERKSKDDGANELLELNLIEVGPTLKGANPETRLITAKSDDEPVRFERMPVGDLVNDETLADVAKVRDQVDAKLLKTGRVLSAKNEAALKQAAELLDQVLSQLSIAETEPKAAAKADDADEQSPKRPSERQEIDLKSLVLELMAPATERGTS
jgi:HK97 family phage prohead protease